ncbi:hypothetical protein EDD11_005668 [Mortierella claussenii]|nr:hypothetical protein EDD11_005668 [Mortierella claussenii]
MNLSQILNPPGSTTSTSASPSPPTSAAATTAPRHIAYRHHPKQAPLPLPSLASATAVLRFETTTAAATSSSPPLSFPSQSRKHASSLSVAQLEGQTRSLPSPARPNGAVSNSSGGSAALQKIRPNEVNHGYSTHTFRASAPHPPVEKTSASSPVSSPVSSPTAITSITTTSNALMATATITAASAFTTTTTMTTTTAANTTASLGSNVITASATSSLSTTAAVSVLSTATPSFTTNTTANGTAATSSTGNGVVSAQLAVGRNKALDMSSSGSTVKKNPRNQAPGAMESSSSFQDSFQTTPREQQESKELTATVKRKPTKKGGRTSPMQPEVDPQPLEIRFVITDKDGQQRTQKQNPTLSTTNVPLPSQDSQGEDVTDQDSLQPSPTPDFEKNFDGNSVPSTQQQKMAHGSN